MADINFNFNTDDLEGLKKLLNQLNKTLKELKKGDIVGQDEAVNAKKVAAEMLKAENAMKRQELSAQGLADRQERLNQKQKEGKGIIGGLEANVKKLRSAYKSANTEAEKKAAEKQFKRVNKELQKAKGTTATWGKALGSFQFKFNALGNIASTVTSKIAAGIKDLIEDSIRMAAEFEGIATAFSKVGDAQLLGELRTATRGAVSDLELMRAAVQASNFKIPLNELSTFLKFAGNRAIESGEDFNFLVESIVKGLGRKSVLILDNLGLSVQEINEEVKLTGDFMTGAASVIEREMAKSGVVVDTTTTEITQMQVAVDNLKLALGQLATETGIVSGTVGFLSDAFMQAANSDIIFKRVSKLSGEELSRTFDLLLRLNNKQGQSFRESIGDFTKASIEIVKASESEIKTRLRAGKFNAKEARVLFDELLRRAEERKQKEEDLKNAIVTGNEEVVRTIGLIKDEIAVLSKKKDEASGSDLRQINQTIKALNDEKKALEELGISTDNARKETLKSIREAINLREKFETKDISDDEFLESMGLSDGQIDEALEAANELADGRDKIADDLAEKQKERAEKEEAFKQAVVQQTFAMVANLSSSLATLVSSNKEKELSAVGDNAEKRLAIEQEYAKKEQLISISQALINGAQAVTTVWKTWADQPWIAAAFTALAVGTVGAQIATIKAQKFEHGGLIDGQPHSQGGTMIEAEKGEYVINRRSTSKYKDLIEGINENDQLKILSALDKDRMMPTIKADPYTKKLYDFLTSQENGYETPSYFVVNKGTQKTMLRK